MPFGKCPICGGGYHLQVTDHAAWYKERGLGFGELLIEKCFMCWRELQPSDRVLILRAPDDAPLVQAGDFGLVIEVIGTESGSRKYRVEATETMKQWSAIVEREAITWRPRGQQPLGPARTALMKTGIVIRFPEATWAWCTMDGVAYRDINVYDIYEQYANWKLTVEELVAEIRRRLGR